MENGNFIPSELTGQGQRNYPRGMSENGGEVPKGPNPEHRAKSVVNNTDSPGDMLEGLSPAEMADAIRMLHEIGNLPSLSGAKGIGLPMEVAQRRLDQVRKQFSPNMHDVRAQLEGPPEPPATDNLGDEIGGEEDTEGAHGTAEEQRIREEINQRQGNQNQEPQNHTRQHTAEQVEEARRNRAAELTKKQTLDWLVDPKARRDYFNQIYALVDAKPYDFWDRAFDQLNDGADEYVFNRVLQNGSRGRWENIVPGTRYDRAIPLRREDVIQALNDYYNREENRDIPEEQRVNIDTLASEISKDFHRFQRERQVRKTLHDVNVIAYFPNVKAEDLFKYMQNFDSASGDLALSIPGVKQMMDIYENTLREIMAENNGWLPPEKMTDDENGNAEATIRARNKFQKMLRAGMIATRTKDGNQIVMDPNTEEWEIDRVFTLARGMMIMSERLITLAAESKYPPNTGGVRNASAFLQDVLQGYSSYAHLLGKWQITREALAAYLFEDQKNETIADFLRGWNPAVLKKAWERFHENPEEIFEHLDENFYLGRRNANRAGDIWTWISWRGELDADVPSMLQDFLKAGQDKMRARWARAHPGEPIPEYFEGLNEYQKWTGTAYRFEKLRGKLSELTHPDSHHRSKAKKIFEEEAKPLIGRMVDLQPHRIYLVSRWVRERVGRGLTAEQKASLSADLENLSLVESAFLNSRERLLDEGKTFDSISLEDMNQFYDQVIADPAERQRAKELAEKIRNDFRDNKEEYWKEFVHKREYTHGYVLWSGDTPIDEYNFSVLGATGGFVRRARDNENQAAAASAETKLLDNLKNIHSTDQLQEALFEIFTPIDHYDRGKAQQAIAEKVEGYIKFFKANWKTNIPLYKVLPIPGRRMSYAQMMYGPHAPAWESGEIRIFIKNLEHAHMITEEQAKILRKKAGGTVVHAGSELTLAFLQLIIAAFAVTVVRAGVEGGKDQLKESS